MVHSTAQTILKEQLVTGKQNRLSESSWPCSSRILGGWRPVGCPAGGHWLPCRGHKSKRALFWSRAQSGHLPGEWKTNEWRSLCPSNHTFWAVLVHKKHFSSVLYLYLFPPITRPFPHDTVSRKWCLCPGANWGGNTCSSCSAPSQEQVARHWTFRAKCSSCCFSGLYFEHLKVAVVGAWETIFYIGPKSVHLYLKSCTKPYVNQEISMHLSRKKGKRNTEGGEGNKWGVTAIRGSILSRKDTFALWVERSSKTKPNQKSCIENCNLKQETYTWN